ncbi:MAG: GntR family transcriptional regulator, N-acetylglucosamine utilization regulator [Pseudonocardiales bacterium]|nr:GntR family transcriptional regulator, N-acetylglucosamine utilization regulator [Pseudonocardiales bacterium]
MAAASMKPVDLGVSVAHVEGRNHAVEAYRILLELLTVGTFAPGTRLPGERALAAQLGVSRATLRHVLGALADAGKIQPSPYRGWFVADRKWVHEPNRLRGFTEVAHEQGLKASARIVRNELRSASLTEAEALGIDTAEQVIYLERVRQLDGAPISVEYSCIPAKRVPGLETVDLADQSLYGVLRERYGVLATRCDYELQAEPATGPVSALLEVPRGEPVLVGYQMTYDQNEQCFDVGKQVYRGDSYRFKASLFRF